MSPSTATSSPSPYPIEAAPDDQDTGSVAVLKLLSRQLAGGFEETPLRYDHVEPGWTSVMSPPCSGTLPDDRQLPAKSLSSPGLISSIDVPKSPVVGHGKPS